MCQICAQTPHKRKTRYSENPPVEGHVGWVIDSTDHVTTASSMTLLEPAVAVTAMSQATDTRYGLPLLCVSVQLAAFLGRLFNGVDLIKPISNVSPSVRTSVCLQNFLRLQ